MRYPPPIAGSARANFPFFATPVKDSAYRARYYDCVMCDPTAGGFTVTLPAAAKLNRLIVVKNASGSTNTITIEADGDDLVDGASSITITTANGSAMLFSDGRGGWWTV